MRSEWSTIRPDTIGERSCPPSTSFDSMHGRGVPMVWRPVRTGPRRGAARGDLAALSHGTLGIAGAVVLMLSGCKAIDDRPATWEYLSPVVFEPTCATGSCHGPASAVAGLDFSTPDRGYTSLTGLWVWIVDPKGTLEDGCMTMQGTVACQRYERPLVVPFNPAQSRRI